MTKKIVPQKIKNIKHYFTALFYCKKYKNPAKKLKIIGVTGSDGKTTTANIIYEILKKKGLKVGIISTINVKTKEKEFDLDFHVTNPSPKDLHKFLDIMVKEEIEYLVLETTSHGLDQYRVKGIEFDFAIFTNVTKEHLDYHKTYEKYLKAKGKLISYTKKNGVVILNKDDNSYRYLSRLAEKKRKRVITYGIKKEAIISAKEIKEEKEGMNFFFISDKENYNVRTNINGTYNVYNILGSIAVATEIKVEKDIIGSALLEIPQIEGRWDVVQRDPFYLVVDFAHTPSGLENVLRKCNKIKREGARVIVLFGCAGERDIEKRPKMGSISARYADIVILTAEDPRGERVEKINSEIIEGIKNEDRKIDYFSITERRDAIRKALRLAKEGDIVLFTGKGSEKSINMDGKNELPWDEKEIAKKEILELKKESN